MATEPKQISSALGRAMGELAAGIDNLREFTVIVEPVLHAHRKVLVSKHAKDLLPLMLVMKEADPERFKKLGVSKEARAKMAKMAAEVVEVTREKKKKGRSFSFRVLGEHGPRFEAAMKEIRKGEFSLQLLYKSVLISLISTVEWFLSRLIHAYYAQFPGLIDTSDKNFTLADLKKFDTVDDARQYLVESKVESIMRGSFDDWLKFFKTQLKLSMGYLEEEIPSLVEACLRRNLIIHSGGAVNSIYLSQVAPALREGRVIGSSIPVTREYLEKRFDAFELNCSLLGLELWKQILPSDDGRADWLLDAVYEHLLGQRWRTAEGLAFFQTGDKKNPKLVQAIGQLNYWLAVKRQGRFDSVRKQVDAEDISAMPLKCQLGWYSLREDGDGFFGALPAALKAEEVSVEELKEFPIFEEMRADDRFSKVIRKGVKSDKKPSPQTKVRPKSRIQKLRKKKR